MASRAPLHPLVGAMPEARTARMFAIVLLVAATLTAGAAWWLFDGKLLIGAALALLLAVAFVGTVRALRGAAIAQPERIDWALLRTAFLDGPEPVTIADHSGNVVLLNPAYEQAFGPHPLSPDTLTGNGGQRLAEASRTAWRDGEAQASGLVIAGQPYTVLMRRAGWRSDHIVQRFRRDETYDPVAFSHSLVVGRSGRRLGEAGVMIVLVDPDGHIIAANEPFLRRALDDATTAEGADLAALLAHSADGSIRLAREPDGVPPVRIIMVPVGDDAEHGPAVFLLLDEDPEVISAAAARGTATQHLHSLLAMLPLGLALVERDGRLLFMNDAFGRAAHLTAADVVVYPSDLVCDEDKPIVSDAVRRFAAGRALPGDLAVRLKHRPDEPVALTIANAKGLGEAAVLLSLKDNSEESKLKRQVAQATKMQAVGQLAGGVAHDFNNILTAIIGHCDLMMMRHTLGDSDYDDIQQIKTNSNRAASLTRQLLAFSRQQTLRPQVLQLPDIISEISNLLRRLLGETVKLEVKHGRNLGAVRADPGQLEQVIVNLAVNARDAMQDKGNDGGTLTLQTYAVSPADVRKMRSEIMPIGAYTALKVIDTGSGIPDEIIGKIFEPFFTTKEVGKGTGLGLSTVYGIVKQTDGFIFAESEIGRGTSFTIYLPVHQMAAAPVAEVAPARVDNGDLWGTGTILLVEDEATVRAVAERALTRQGYRVLTATNGEEALEILEDGAETIDLLVSDVVMPTMDGPALVRAARERFPDLRVLFMSGYAEEQLRKSIDIERVDFLAKPFSVQQLGQAARDALAAAIPDGKPGDTDGLASKQD